MVQVGRKVHVCLLLGRTGLARLTLERILHVGISFSFPPVCEEDGTARKPESEGEESVRLALLYLPLSTLAAQRRSLSRSVAERGHTARRLHRAKLGRNRGAKRPGDPCFFNGCIPVHTKPLVLAWRLTPWHHWLGSIAAIPARGHGRGGSVRRRVGGSAREGI